MEVNWRENYVLTAHPFTLDAAPIDDTQVGGKARALIELVNSGFHIPEFFVLTPESFTENGLRDEFNIAFNAALDMLGSDELAVRSSGVDEDGHEHSHAGQFLTILNVKRDKVKDAAQKVWQSGTAAHLNSYRAERSIHSDNPNPAVLIQRMMKPRVAGVAFSADPVSGRRDRFVISAIEGLADKLVNGEADGETYLLNAQTGEPVSDWKTQNTLLSSKNLQQIFELCRDVATYFGCPHDIEWAIEGETLYLLQARPITSSLRPQPIDDQNVIILDNSNIIESYPGFVTPLTYSFAQYSYARVYRQFVSLLGVPEDDVRAHGFVFDNMLSYVDGRVYYNLLNWYRALALLPGFSRNRENMELMMGVNEPLPSEFSKNIGPKPATGWARARESAKLVFVGFRLLKEAVVLKRTNNKFMARVNEALQRNEDDIQDMSLSELAKEYRAIEAQILERWDAPLINDFLCMMAFGRTRKMMEIYAGDAGLRAHNEILIGQGDIISAEPAKRLKHIAELAAPHLQLIEALENSDEDVIKDFPEIAYEISSYIEKFKDRCIEELKLESITLDQDPSPFYASIAAAARRVSMGARMHERTSNNSGQLAFDEALEDKPFHKYLMRPLLRWTKHRVRDRENLRFERTRVFGRARRLFRAMGVQFYALGLLENAEDIFMLTVSEILGTIEGFATDRQLSNIVKWRKDAFELQKSRPDRPSRIYVNGNLESGLIHTNSVSKKRDEDDTRRHGTGCSAGVYTGSVKVISNPAQDRLAPGEILVARHTDPGWITVFSNASAIIVERGSLLSHSAIVARELGIPCVVAMEGAMNWLKSGDVVKVDGQTGMVEKIDIDI